MIKRIRTGRVFGWKTLKDKREFLGEGSRERAIMHLLETSGKEEGEDQKNLRLDKTRQSLKEFVKQQIIANKSRMPGRRSVWFYPGQAEREYSRYVQKLMREFGKLVTREIKPLLGRWKREAKESLQEDDLKGITRQDDPVAEFEIINRKFTAMQGQLFVENRTKIVADVSGFFIATEQHNQIQFQKALRAALGSRFIAGEPWLDPLMKFWVLENISLIKGLTDEYLKTIQFTVYTGWQKGETAGALSRKLTKANKAYTGYRARLIARDQIGKLSGQLTKKRQESVGVELYEWSTSSDERVRGDHIMLNGVWCKWDDPTVYSIDEGETWNARSRMGATQAEPGEDIQCRCVALPVFKYLIEEIEKEI